MYENPFIPGNRSLISAQHAELVNGLKDLNHRMTSITVQERAILKMAIDLLEYMHDYAMGPANGEWEAMTKKQQNAELARPDALPKTFTVDEFLNDLICSGGIELHDGRCAPRF